MHSDLLLVVVVVTALGFDFTNGFHDTANAMAASIATGALRPRVAVALSAVLNLVGAFLSLAVAATIAKGIVDQGLVTPTIIFAGLVGAIMWNLATWYIGLPSSSSHALIGGVVGATLVGVGTQGVLVAGVLQKVLLPALLAPLIAAVVGAIATFTAYRLTSRVEPGLRGQGFRLGQIGTASLLSLAHGTNDAQKTMGVITLALVANGTLAQGAAVPAWVVVSCAVALAAGTYLGGWRIIRTLGTRIVPIQPPQGFAADGSSAAVLLVSSHLGLPLSTTHIASGSIIGSGVGRRLAEVRWSMAGRMAGAWALTFPSAAVVGALAWEISNVIGGPAGVTVMGVLAALLATGLAVASRRHPDHSRPVAVADPRPARGVGDQGRGAAHPDGPGVRDGAATAAQHEGTREAGMSPDPVATV